MTTSESRIPSSFRDPSGFVFVRNKVLYRQVNQSYRTHYDRLMESDLYACLVSDGLLVEHHETDESPPEPDRAYKVIRPKPVPFVSYPYEWSFSMLKAAALATLRIHQAALEHGMVLKDASAYNIQFVDAKPVFIDTLSFDTYRQGEPWIAYRQFCQHFLAPLVLMAYCDVRLSQLLRVFIDGIPLDLASRLLPFRTRLRPATLFHIHLHAKSQARHADDAAPNETKPSSRASRGRMSKRALAGLADSLRSIVEKLRWKPVGTEWGAYYDCTAYTDEAMAEKRKFVTQFIETIGPKTVWDLGANTGAFSRIASEKGIQTVAFDIDPAAVEKNFLACVEKNEARLLPLVLDLTNPSPPLGWHNRERQPLYERGPADVVLALALIHHLAISNNVPLPMLADFFAGLCHDLIIEFVPKTDPQVQRLLATREDIFPDYSQEGFEAAFAHQFLIEEKRDVTGAGRILYRLKRIEGEPG